MQITIPFDYTEEIVPKRCYLSRRVSFQGETTVTIHEITKADAPIAIRQMTDIWVMRGGRERLQKTPLNYRWWHGKLWLPSKIQRVSHGPCLTQTASQFKNDPWPFNLTRPDHIAFYLSLKDQRKRLRRWASRIVFIDGQRYEQVKEPRYVIMTFGLGCNHGIGYGTSLETDNDYNSNIGASRYFRCDQYNQAVAEATRIATNRGDTKALPIVSQKPDTFEILIPEALRLAPAREHGKGDPFINSIESMIETVKNPLLAGIGAIGLLSKEMAA